MCKSGSNQFICIGVVGNEFCITKVNSVPTISSFFFNAMIFRRSISFH